jgi:LuxR family glucitol operon transcriptional activator
MYELGELPRLFILRNHAPKAEQVSKFQRLKREIRKLHEKLQADENTNKYDSKHISRRTADDTVVAKYLMEALRLSAQRDPKSALQLVEKAKSLDPSFYEVHRVEAMIQKWHGNHAAAMQAYDVAIACEPRSAPLRYWYAGFLLRDAEDLESALEQLKIANSLDPSEPQILMELARVHLFNSSYEKADEAISPVLIADGLSMKAKRKAYDVWLQITYRLSATGAW